MKKVLLFSASILALTASPSLAIDASTGSETDAYKNTVFKLGEIAVSVVDETTTVGSRNIISAEEIQAYTDTDTLEKAIVLLPGVDASKVERKNETSVSIGGFTTAGLKVLYKPMTDFEITVGVDNIFDKNYELTEGYPEEGRNYFITLTKKF